MRANGDVNALKCMALPTGEVLISPSEESALRTYGRRLASQGIGDDAGHLAIAYGAYFPQLGVAPSQVEEDVAGAVGHRLGYVLGDVVQSLGLLDVKLSGEPMPGRLACAALVRIAGTAVSLLREQRVVLAAFLRFSNLDAATNILNRPGVFALAALSPVLSEEQSLGWRDRVNPKVLRRAAKGIR